MIEIEKKFALQPGDEERLVVDAEFVKEVRQDDEYWDTTNFSLTRKDWWLRRRNGRWEIKIALHAISPGILRGVTQYRELETEEKIRMAIGLDGDGPFEDVLRTAGYVPCARIVTTRRKYRDHEFCIDLDVADFGYALAEIEIMVEDEKDADAASARVDAYAMAHGLSADAIRGKVVEFIRRERPEHFQALVDAGVIC
ncbi:hypothetical protein A2348_05395 [Candidatus Uhrbacteria bacterium RIFOXYB12_FULL_58_10]|uniref:CYTH domain-containing protein n=1 Tax=Candidatus Uhrbacteria bacterium RIFOXYB2_FULL_57_15 TaxID=1802422 RepID=A0A1F7W7W9_9BACT|nr:MAG: hypothetical protein A2348_05395 [Candidatus Uhrbacteria bacterium RIFOXYB12_FULL_58_10]OGL98905.1 MAG: hypothetical protein A2304_04100 [Candidatus Uhrbacteria bacterium RIFOXYB2_FULL_57_15]OGM00058.1 MAG: hypothetical protein A2501_03860 [Candidatus Uhrbacteria bacterium RIFOXYC12_FULL_57_11]